MQSIWDYFLGSLTHPAGLAASAVILYLYRLFALKLKKLQYFPVGLFIIYLVIRLAMRSLPADIDSRVNISLDVLSGIALYIGLVRFFFSFAIDGWIKFRKKDALPKITREFLMLIIFSIIILVVLRTRGNVNLTGLITTSAVLTAVIGLAAQNTLGNLFSGLSIQLEKPYCIGDWIQYDNYVGQVAGISWKSTRILTFEDELIFIPNLDISQKVVKNYSLPTKRHIMKIDIGADYDSPPNKVIKTLLDICKQQPGVIQNPQARVRVTGYGDCAINYQVRLFYEDFGTSPDLRASFEKRIWYAFRRSGIKIPFPIRDVHVKHVERRFEEQCCEEMRSEAIRDLDAIPIMKPLTQTDRDRIAAFMSVEEYGDGEIIVKQGNDGDSLYIIHRGICNVDIESGTGQTKRVATLRSPSFFGEMSLLTGEPRSATVTADGDVTVFSIGKDIFREVLVAHPEISEELAMVLAKRQEDQQDLFSKEEPDRQKRVTKLLGKIRSFFKIV